MRAPAVCLLSAAVVAASAGDAPTGGSVRFDAATHEPLASSGCGQASPYSTGKSVTATVNFQGNTWTYRVYVPKAYNPKNPMPLIVEFPGWGMSAQQEEKGAGITGYADQLGFISVTAQGMGDNSNWGGPWYSWNAVGSTQSPGPAGPTCTAAASNSGYCYNSCGACGDNPQCWWTTCRDSVTPTGTGKANVNGFVVQLYNTLESQLCIDTTREYASGESNGGMFTYQVGVDMAQRFAAITPGFGSFHRGFNELPSVGLPVLEYHGKQDTTVPANVSLSGDGYYYTTVSEIYGGNSYAPGGWKAVNGCSGPRQHYPTSWDGVDGLYCMQEGTACTGGAVVRCAWNGGHNWFSNSPQGNGGLVTEFLLSWTKPSHVGGGRSRGAADEVELDATEKLQDITISLEDEDESSLEADYIRRAPRTLQPGQHAAKQHYGNPRDGCLDDEDVIRLGSGHACAPRIGYDPSPDVSQPPVPHCSFGGLSPKPNGCPIDAQVGNSSIAWPVCLAKGNTTDPFTNGEFHCLLVCPCWQGGSDCGPNAHAQCPTGARCERGELLHMAHGVCTYPTSSQPDMLLVV